MFKIFLTIIFVITILNTILYNSPALHNEGDYGNGNIHVGHQIKNARLTRKYSQSELARRSGLTLNQIQSFEGGKAIPTQEYLRKIQEILNCDIVK